MSVALSNQLQEVIIPPCSTHRFHCGQTIFFFFFFFPCRRTLQPLDLLVRTRLTTSPAPLWCDALSDCLPVRVQCVPISSEAVFYRVELCFSFITCLSSESGEDPKLYPAGLHRRPLTGTWCGRVTNV